MQACFYPVDRGRRGAPHPPRVLASSLRLSGPRPVGRGWHAGGGGVASAPQVVRLRLCPHDREEPRAHAVHLFNFWAQVVRLRLCPHDREELRAHAGSGHSPRSRRRFWAHATHLELPAEFWFTKVAYDTVAVTYDSLIAFIVRPQGQHNEISPPGQAGRTTARSRPRPRPHGHAARFDCIKIAGVTLDYIKVSSSTFVRAKVANIAVDRTKIASSTFDDTLREATPVGPS